MFEIARKYVRNQRAAIFSLLLNAYCLFNNNYSSTLCVCFRKYDPNLFCSQLKKFFLENKLLLSKYYLIFYVQIFSSFFIFQSHENCKEEKEKRKMNKGPCFYSIYAFFSNSLKAHFVSSSLENWRNRTKRWCNNFNTNEKLIIYCLIFNKFVNKAKRFPSKYLPIKRGKKSSINWVFI